RDRLEAAKAEAEVVEAGRIKAEAELEAAREHREQAEEGLADETRGEDPDRELDRLAEEIAAARQVLVPLDAVPQGDARDETRESVRLVRLRIEEDLKARRQAHDAADAEWHQLVRDYDVAK